MTVAQPGKPQPGAKARRVLGEPLAFNLSSDVSKGQSQEWWGQSGTLSVEGKGRQPYSAGIWGLLYFQVTPVEGASH